MLTSEDAVWCSTALRLIEFSSNKIRTYSHSVLRGLIIIANLYVNISVKKKSPVQHSGVGTVSSFSCFSNEKYQELLYNEQRFLWSIVVYIRTSSPVRYFKFVLWSEPLLLLYNVFNVPISPFRFSQYNTQNVQLSQQCWYLSVNFDILSCCFSCQWISPSTHGINKACTSSLLHLSQFLYSSKKK